MKISRESMQALHVTVGDAGIKKESGEIHYKTIIECSDKTFDRDEFMKALHKEIVHYERNHTYPVKISMSYKLLTLLKFNLIAVTQFRDSTPTTIFGRRIIETQDDGWKCIVELDGVNKE